MVVEALGASAILRPCEDVADAAHGDDTPGVLRIVLDGGTQPADMDIDRTVDRLQRLTPGRVDQLLAGGDAARALRENEKGVKLMGGHGARFAGDPHRAR